MPGIIVLDTEYDMICQIEAGSGDGDKWGEGESKDRSNMLPIVSTDWE